MIIIIYFTSFCWGAVFHVMEKASFISYREHITYN